MCDRIPMCFVFACQEAFGERKLLRARVKVEKISDQGKIKGLRGGSLQPDPLGAS